jgi:L-ascorbate metabolism protein UlaG (beta-lactamase superfamily)
MAAEILRARETTATRDHTMTTSFGNTLTLSSIEVGAARILIDPFLSNNPSWDKGWIGSRADEDSTQGGVR